MTWAAWSSGCALSMSQFMDPKALWWYLLSLKTTVGEGGGSDVQFMISLRNQSACDGISALVLPLSHWTTAIVQGQRGCCLMARRLSTEREISSLKFCSKNAVYAFLCYYHWAQCWVEKPHPGIFSQGIKRISSSPAASCWIIALWAALYDGFIVREFRCSSHAQA